MEEPCILLVDDEQPVLSAWSRILKDSYRVCTAGSGDEALEILRQENVAVIIADYRMPGMDGLQVLQTVRQTHPSVVRILVSAFMDELAMRTSMEDVAPYRILEKPVDVATLEETVRDAMYIHSIYSRGSGSIALHLLDSMLGSLDSVPAPFVRNFFIHFGLLKSNPSVTSHDSFTAFADIVAHHASADRMFGFQFSSDEAWKAVTGQTTDGPYSLYEEHFDGSGPKGLKGLDIPAQSRLLAPVYFHHLLGIHLSRPRISVNILKFQSGEIFDPMMVRLVLDSISDFPV